MAAPKSYMKQGSLQRADLIKQIGHAFDQIDKIKYPYIYENIQKDESRMALIERIINEIYSKSQQVRLEQIFNLIEISLGD